jgi:hypothetical protein
MNNMLIFEELIKENNVEFCQKETMISQKLIVDPNHLMFLMWVETAHTLDHRIVNYQKGDDKDPNARCLKRATGLIQFMPATARFLGTTTCALRQMTNVEQLDYVYKHLSLFKGKYKDWLDLYCGIFWPAAVGKPDTFRITPDIVAKQNPLYDINKDGDIEKSEIRAALRKQVPAKYASIIL